jgi:acylphosphatase
VSDVRLTAWVHGRVQGVGMRWWIRSRARELGLVGWARNLDDGRVEIVAEGDEAACRALLALLQPGALPALLQPGDGGHARPGRIDAVVERWSGAGGLGNPGETGFFER